MRKTLFAATALGTSIMATGAVAQEVEVVRSDPMTYRDWATSELYAGDKWSAERVLGADLYGNEGAEIGSVANLVLDRSGEIEAMIAEVGGLWDIGDTHVRIPWDEVTIAADADELRIVVPLTEANMNDYGLFLNYGDGQFPTVAEDPAAPRSWRITEILDDYVRLADGTLYGYVDDAVFDGRDQLAVIVVDAVGPTPYGRVAYPFYGADYGWAPGHDAYVVPFDQADVETFEPVDIERLFESQPS